MCDYSLEAYQSRDAVKGEELVTRRFPTGSQGFVSPQCPGTAVCLKEEMKLLLRDIPEAFSQSYGIGSEEIARFGDLFLSQKHNRDALFFSNGRSILIDDLPEGLHADVIGKDMKLAATYKIQQAAGRVEVYA